MVRLLVVLTHVRNTTFSYELSERIASADDVDVTVISYYDSSLEDAAVSAETNVEVVPLNAESRFDIAAIRQLRWHLKTRQYDILHTHHNFVGSLARLLAPRGTVIVDTEHADHKQHYSLPQVLVNIPTLPRARRVVGNSEQTLQSLYWFERLVLSQRKLDVIYNGVDVERIDSASTITPNPYEIEGDRITSVGRFSKTKNQSTLLRAFATISSEFPNTRLTLVGDGPLRSELESLAQSLGIEEAVEFTGFIDRDEVYQLLAASDLYVHPSLSEGFCMAVVEAMASNVPVIVSDIEVFYEVVGAAGVYAAPTDPDEFAGRIREFLENPALQTEFAEKAYDRSRSRFHLEKTADEYRELYAELMGT
jgi:L-malate glycosyltransferase